MSSNPVTISPEATIEELVELMISNRIKRVLVVVEEKITGIVTRSDLMRAVLRIMPDTNTSVGSDNDIRSSIVNELKRHSWSGQIQVTVHAGVVEFYGAIFDETVRDAVRVAAENIPGVKSILDHMLYIQPFSGLCLGSPDKGEP